MGSYLGLCSGKFETSASQLENKGPNAGLRTQVSDERGREGLGFRVYGLGFRGIGFRV